MARRSVRFSGNPEAFPMNVAVQRRPAVASWQRALQAAVRDPAELLRALELDAGLLPAARRAAEAFPLLVPREFLARMRKGDPRDPLLAQVLPLAAELEAVPGYGCDPVDEAAARAAPALLRKYEGRALLVTSGACAVHCRYCFRRHFDYGEAALSSWEPALEAVAADASLREVILSGGDPLTLPDARLARLARRLAAIPHLRRLRVHTRLPIVLPQRVDDALLEWLCGTRLQPVLVLHANHPAELDAGVVAALARLRAAGVSLLNQAVLLRGVNDDANVLCALSEALFAAGVLPYYLHLLDPVAGAAHFDVDEAEAGDLLERVRAKLPGYLVPRLVREVPGAPAKLPR